MSNVVRENNVNDGLSFVVRVLQIVELVKDLRLHEFTVVIDVGPGRIAKWVEKVFVLADVCDVNEEGKLEKRPGTPHWVEHVGEFDPVLATLGLRLSSVVDLARRLGELLVLLDLVESLTLLLELVVDAADLVGEVAD